MILIVNNHSKKVKFIEHILRENGVRYIVKDQRSLFKTVEKHRYKGVILSGGKPDLDEKIYLRSIKANIACLVNYDVPILGICEGHQIICDAAGGEIVKMKKASEYPNLKVRLKKRSKIFRGLPATIEVVEHHGRYAKAVPKELEIVASSKKNKIEAVFHKKRPIFGVQFHPEVSGIWGSKILKNFINICNKY